MKIGLTYTEVKSRHSFYVDWLKSDEPVEIIKLDRAGKNAHELEQCDGLVLSGGVDVHPDFYNGSSHYALQPKNGWKRERDEFEMALLKRALEKQLPVLAICRGMQLANVTLGGTLMQDLGQLNDIHMAISPAEDRKHKVVIEPQTFLHAITSRPDEDVNSAHHQCIQTLGNNLRVNARAADGTIEGIEWADPKSKPFFLGVQWHPERMFRFALGQAPLSKNIRDRFIAEIKNANSL